jgi:hypothetical protein
MIILTSIGTLSTTPQEFKVKFSLTPEYRQIAQQVFNERSGISPMMSSLSLRCDFSPVAL